MDGSKIRNARNGWADNGQREAVTMEDPLSKLYSVALVAGAISAGIAVVCIVVWAVDAFGRAVYP